MTSDCKCSPAAAGYDNRDCPTHGPDAPRYVVDHDTIHDRVTGKHVDLDEAAGMLSVEPEAMQRVAWGVVVKLGAALKNAEHERDNLRNHLTAIRSHIAKWDWAELLADAQCGDFDSVALALKDVAAIEQLLSKAGQ